MTEAGWAKALECPYVFPALGGLLVLQCLHIFWSSLIVKMVVDSVRNEGNVSNDVRDIE